MVEGPTDQGAAPVLEGAARHVLKATLVPVALPARRGDDPGRPGDAVLKQSTIARLALAPGEVDAVVERVSHRDADASPGAPVSTATGRTADRLPTTPGRPA